MQTFAIDALNGISYGLLLFMLSAGLTLIFSMLGVLNFAHASFYMLGAYLGVTLASSLGFGWALVLAPLVAGLARHARHTRRVRRVRFGIEDAWTLFPVLRERRAARAGVLSGGEQQMLALARALVGDPDLLIVDEPTEGLAAQMIARVGECLRTLRERGVAVLLIEQRLALAPELADRVAVMGHGRIVFDGTPRELAAREDLVREWLGIG